MLRKQCQALSMRSISIIKLKKGIKVMKIFSAKNLSLANYLIDNGCKVIRLKKNLNFKTMILIDFEYTETLANALSVWTKTKHDECLAKGIEN